MCQQEAIRRLVKSPPELWAQCSDPLLLGQHLSGFGTIRITRLDPESTVAWEGESVSGTVSLEESGWGTRVHLTATTPSPVGAAESARTDVASATSEPMQAATVEFSAVEVVGRAVETTETWAPIRLAVSGPRGLSALVGRVRRRRRDDRQIPAPDLSGERPVTPGTPEPRAVTPATELSAGLEAALDSLGQAHRRPYSRS